MPDAQHDDVVNLQAWASRIEATIGHLEVTNAGDPLGLCEAMMDYWQQAVVANPTPRRSSPAALLIIETLHTFALIMTSVAFDLEDTPDCRDRMTEHDARELLRDGLAKILKENREWLTSMLPAEDTIVSKIESINASLSAIQRESQDRIEKNDADDLEATLDQYGAILGYSDPDVDAAIIFKKMSSFNELEDKEYTEAHERLRKMIDSELLRHVSDESDRFCDVLIAVLSELKERSGLISDADALDERRRKLRSALISFTSALHSHKEQSIRQARDQFGRKTPQLTAVEALFDDLLADSFEYGWLLTMRNALLHGDINAFKYNFTVRQDGEDEVNVLMHRNYMLTFTREDRKSKWLKRTELANLQSDPSILDMLIAIQPLMGKLQDDLDAVLYPNVNRDASKIRDLIALFEGRPGLYALQTGPGFTHRLKIPPYTRLAPRVLQYAESLAPSPTSPQSPAE